MTDGKESSAFETTINGYYERLKAEEDYFQLMEIPRSATQKQIETAYTKKIEQDFPRSKIEHMADAGMKEKAVYILQRIDYMYSHLINFEKRAEYESKISAKIDKQETPADVPKEDPVEQARGNYKLGKSLYDQKAYPMALSALTEAVRLDPTKAAYFHQLGLCQLKDASLRREAEKNLQKAIELEPWNAGHHAALGMLYFNVKMHVRAKACFSEALSLDPENALAKKGLEKTGPRDKPSALKSAQDFLKKAMPSFFDKK
jgi:tetratricopeptide (TPR) repeat protein